MKQVKKFVSLCLTLVMLFAMTVTAMAVETTYSITINNDTEGHTYEAYQIFTGDLNESTLSNIQWGSGVSDAGKTALGDAAAKAETLKTKADAEAFAAEVAPYLATAAGSATEPSEGKYVINNLPAGYYLIKDQDNSLNENENDSYTSYILRVAGNVEVTPKSGTPTSQKKVKDTDDTKGTTTDWQDSADYDIGDKVSFQLKGILPANYGAYKTYNLVFHDVHSEGLTFDKTSVEVKVDGKTVDSSNYKVVTDGLTDGCTFEVQFDNVKTITSATAGSEITVEYEATLNDKAVVGSQGNPNGMHMTFSNNPNGEGTGTTPTDKAIVFTYKTIINKVDQDNKSLAGAEFKLEKKLADGTWKEIAAVKNTEGTSFTFNGLDDGTYRLTETTTPAGYNTIEPIEFTVTAEHDILSDNPALTVLNGNVTSGEITFTPDTANGSLSTDVVNQSGSTLPSTGGMGTTIFYIAGAILVAGAVVLLITKKRMGDER